MQISVNKDSRELGCDDLIHDNFWTSTQLFPAEHVVKDEVGNILFFFLLATDPMKRLNQQ